jgi:hypothetical protein
MRDLPLAPTATSLTVRPWHDPVVDDVGFDARSPYVETYWLGVLGPTATWLVRRLAQRLDAQPEGFELDLAAIAAELGVGARSSKHAPFVRSLQRCAHFGIVELTPGGTLRVRRKLPPLSRFQLSRLPAHLRAAHDRPSAPIGARPTVDELRERARGYALSLAAQGLDEAGVERGLHELGVHPAMAHAAVSWAMAHTSDESDAAAGGTMPPAA